MGRHPFVGRLLGNKAYLLSALVVLIAVAAAFTSPFSPYEPNANDLLHDHEGPSRLHWLGTDYLGRDILSRLMHGARVSLQVGVLAVAASYAIGIALGLLAGIRGGLVDELTMRLMDAVFVIPGLLLALAIAAALGPSIVNVMIAISVTFIAGPARLMRGQVLAVREFEYVLAARSFGASALRIALRHVLPNTLAALIVSGTLDVARAILIEASLSFLGAGIRPPAASWGNMLQQGYTYMELNLIEPFAPGIAIFLIVLAINLLGDALREAWDPRLRGTR
ncbi:MAG: ABC transporter permease [Chloroflexi bacterium]|nr:ABC transporter permease [Chloroflexota bacterium]